MTENIWVTTGDALALLFSFDKELWEIILVSLRVAVATILISMPITFILAFMLSNSNWRLEKFIITITHTLVAVPAVVIGLLVYILLSRHGVLGDLKWLFTQKAMVLGQFLLAFPILLNISYSGFKSIHHSATETAVTLGANRLQLALTIMFEARFALLTAITTGFGRIIAEVGCAMMVGGNILHYTRNITTAITLETTKGNFAQGIALGLVLVFLALVLNFLILFLNKKSLHETSTS